jgi:hypothetical protein
MASQGLDPMRRGFALVRGRVMAVEPRRPGVRVVLDGGFVAWVPRAALAAFSDIEGLEGELVEARGRLRGYQDELQVTVRHPFALAVIEAP